MRLEREVSFYSNTPDNTHCFQAALRMVMGYFWPDREYSWEELDSITAKVEGLWTWPMAGLLWLQERGFEISVVETFDYKAFIERGGQYLIEEYGEEYGNAQIEHSDIEQERRLATEFIEKVAVEKRTPTLEDIKDFLSKGYLVICNVNSRVLKEEPGYVGHSVLVIGFNDNRFYLHDPGVPAFENRAVEFSVFERAWAYPNDKAKNITAFRLES